MASHHDWIDDCIAEHALTKPFAPENGQALKFSPGDRVIFTNDYGAKFTSTVRALFPECDGRGLYARGYRYYLADNAPWMPVTESSLEHATAPQNAALRA